MRRVWAYLMVLAAVCTACRKAPFPGGDRLIGFTASDTPATKVMPEVPDDESYLIAAGKTIGVYATWTSPEGESTDVFSKIPVTCYDNGEGADPRYSWDYNPHKFWRSGGRYYFRAVYPYGVSTQFGADGTRMVASYSMLSENYDLMVADAERDLRTVDDTSPVHFRFKHACAAVRVLFSKGSADVNRHYYLRSCEFCYLKSVGVLVYEGGDPALSCWNTAEFRSPSVLVWNAASDDDRLDVPDAYTDFCSLESDTWVPWHFVIPQNLNAADGQTPAIRFSVDVVQLEEDGKTVAYASSAPVYTTLSLPLSYEDEDHTVRQVQWEPGKMYTYYIQIQPGRASITVKVAPWDSYYVYVDDIVF